MKKIPLIFICILPSFSAYSDIKNGYQEELIIAEQSLNNLSELLRANIDDNDDRLYNLKSHYLRAKRTYDEVKTYYVSTEKLINDLITKHPEFYYQLWLLLNPSKPYIGCPVESLARRGPA